MKDSINIIRDLSETELSKGLKTSKNMFISPNRMNKSIVISKLNELQIIQNKIYEIRGQRVMLDRDLASLYQVETKALNQAVKRNIQRFPADFMFQLTTEETENWKSQIVTSNSIKMGVRRNPYAFTEGGVAMLSSVLNSEVAINANIAIIRAFIQMHNYLSAQQTIPAELSELRSRMQLIERDTHDNLEAMNDLSEDLRKDIDAIYMAIGALSVKVPQAQEPRQPMGFQQQNRSRE